MAGQHLSPRRSRLWAAGVAAAVVVVAAVAAGVVAWRSGASRSADGAGVSSGRGAAPASTTTTAPPPPLTVTSVTPANGATNVSGVTPVVVNFSAPLAPSSPMPVVSPTVPGSWQPAGPAALSFTPTVAFAPYSAVTVTVPGGAGGALAKDGARLASPFVDHVMIAAGSELRLQELLAGLAYLPLTWTPSGATPAATDAAGQATAAFNPPAGTFAWAQTTWPASLTSQWQAGAANLVTKGAVMAFEADHGLTVDGVAGSHVWAALLAAVPAGTANTGGYNYALGSKTHPQGLTIWHNGSEVFHSTANFGISVAPTADGTFPVYARLRNQVMRGNNPGGGTYADPVQYVAYFNGGDAVHYIARSNYGSPASLGCIELPLAQAAEAWPYLSLGTLVTVAG